MPDGTLTAAVEHGMTKINIATHLNKVYTGAVRDRLGADPALVDPRGYIAAAREAVVYEIARLLAVIRADGRVAAPQEATR